MSNYFKKSQVTYFTPAYQSWDSCGDESETLCPKCEYPLDDWEYGTMKRCPDCKQRILTRDEMEFQEMFGLFRRVFRFFWEL
jgi:DNA-directed RNA polymerase subunit RPC12/RpoP